MSVSTENPAGATAIRPFTVPKVPDAELEALRARTRPPAGLTRRPLRTTRRACRWR